MTYHVEYVYEAIDKYTKVAKNINKEAQRQNKLISGLKNSLIGLAAGFGALSIIKSSVKKFIDFEKSMSNVSTLIDTNVESLDEMKRTVLDIASRTPVELEELTGALYDIRSAGISAADQFDVLENSAKLAVAGLGTTAEAADLVTSSINAFNLQGEEQKKVYDVIFKTVRMGKTTIAGLAQGFGAVAGTIAGAGIQLDEYLASVAALTTTGLPAAQAHTQIKAAVAGLTRESKDSVKVFRQLGAKSFKDLIQKSGGMVNAFKAVTKTVKGNDAMIIKLFGSTEAYNAVLGLTGKQAAAFTSTLDYMRKGENAVEEAFAKQNQTADAQMKIFSNNISKLQIAFAQALLPALNSVMSVLAKVVDKLAKNRSAMKALETTAKILGAAFEAIGWIILRVMEALEPFIDMLGTAAKISEDIAGVFSGKVGMGDVFGAGEAKAKLAGGPTPEVMSQAQKLMAEGYSAKDVTEMVVSGEINLTGQTQNVKAASISMSGAKGNLGMNVAGA